MTDDKTKTPMRNTCQQVIHIAGTLQQMQLEMHHKPMTNDNALAVAAQVFTGMQVTSRLVDIGEKLDEIMIRMAADEYNRRGNLSAGGKAN